MSSYDLLHGGDLTHYGTKGMRWGVRKKRSSRRARAAKQTAKDAKSLRDAGYKKEAAAVSKVSKKLAKKPKSVFTKKSTKTIVLAGTLAVAAASLNVGLKTYSKTKPYYQSAFG